MDKVERYEWAKPGDRGRRADVAIDSLRIDHSYQRGEVSDFNTLSIARDFRWDSFGTLTVMERANGDLFVVDGQQRLCGAKKRGDLRTVPCTIFKSEGRDHEARAFLALNTHRKLVSAVQKFVAADRANVNPEREIANWLRGIGLHITNDGKTSQGVCFPAHLVRTWETNKDAAMKAIELQRVINDGQPLVSCIHDGLWWLLNEGVDVGAELRKIRMAGGRVALEQYIHRYRIETQTHSLSFRVCGVGILLLINHKKHNKIPVPETT